MTVKPSALITHNASLVRYNQTRVADSGYCGVQTCISAKVRINQNFCKSFLILFPTCSARRSCRLHRMELYRRDAECGRCREDIQAKTEWNGSGRPPATWRSQLSSPHRYHHLRNGVSPGGWAPSQSSASLQPQDQKKKCKARKRTPTPQRLSS